jgi:hypothetical protein
LSRKVVRKVIRSQANEGQLARERLMLIWIFEELHGLGYPRAATTRFGVTRSDGAPSAAPRWRKPMCA